MNDSSSLPASTAATPERVFSGLDQAALWFSLGVGLLVMQTGAYLAPAVGTRAALWATMLGSAVGSGLLAWVAWLACASGRSSAQLMHAVYGSGFARLPVLLNVLQLIGWSTFELVIMRDGTRAIVSHSYGVEIGVVWPTLFWGIVALLMIRTSMLTLVRRVIGKIGLPLVILSLLWLSYQFGVKVDGAGWRALWQGTGDGSMNAFQAFDLVIAMPVSWLPLVADYARHSRTGRGAFAGTWIGYGVANVWCYALGVLVVAVIGNDADHFVDLLLFAQGGLVALGLILVDELDNNYGDLYSASVSAQSVWRRVSVRTWGTVLAVLSMAFAMVLPMHSLEPFLLLLSSVFVPLFGVMLGWLLWQPGRVEERVTGVRWVPAVIWLVGIAVYHGLAQWAPELGSALPTLVVTFVLARVAAQMAVVRLHVA